MKRLSKSRSSPFALWQQALIMLLVGTLYWGLVARLSGVDEPWDASLYWPVLYPGSIVIAGALAATSRWRPDLIGISLTLPQVFILFLTTGATPMMVVGLGFAVVLSLPAVLVAWLASLIVQVG